MRNRVAIIVVLLLAWPFLTLPGRAAEEVTPAGNEGAAPAPWLRDPFRYSPSEPAGPRRGAEKKVEETRRPSQAPPAVEGILVDEDSAVALVNGRQVTAGDEVGGWRIRRIAPGRLVVESGNRREEIILFGEQEEREGL